MAISKYFKYEDGKLFRKLKNGALKETGCLDGRGYLISGYKGKLLKTHRIIWEMLNGPIPKGYQIDHINGIKTDNQIENLRLATHSENNCNKDSSNIGKLPSGNWRVRIYKDSVKRFDKVFSCLNRAKEMRDDKLKEIHKQFCYVGLGGDLSL